MTTQIQKEHPEFFQMLDQATAITKLELKRLQEEDEDEALIKQAKTTLEELDDTRKGIESGLLIPSRGAVLGLTRFIGDWSNNRELKDIAYELDKYYSEKMC